MHARGTVLASRASRASSRRSSIDSLELERRVLESTAAARALEGVRPLGLVGVALLPGPLRRPLGLTRPLRGPDDYAGTTFGLRFGRVAQSSIEALGATPAGYRDRLARRARRG